LAFLFLPFLLAPPHTAVFSSRLWARSVKFLARIICGIRMEVRGQEYVPKGGALVAAKHQSAWETLMMYLILDYPVFVLKESLMRIPLFGRYLKQVRAISIDRSGGTKTLRQLVEDVKERMDEEKQVIIFPEGTRITPGEKGKYHSGIAALYSGTGATVTPVALNSGLCWGKNSFLKKAGTIVIEFLPPIEPGLKKSEFMKVLEERIETASQKLFDEGDKN